MTYTHASGCITIPVPFLGPGADVSLLDSCEEGSGVLGAGGGAGPSGEYTAIILAFGKCNRGCASALCIAFLDAERTSAWYRVGFGSKSFSPRRGILALFGSARLV